MGKMKRSRGKNRCTPTGLPSLQDIETEREFVPDTMTPPVLHKLSSIEGGEREWACRSIAHLVCEAESQQTLIDHKGLPHLLVPLLLDREWGVREAAAGALRNISVVGGEQVNENLVRADVITALSVMLKEIMHQLQIYHETKEPQTSINLPTPPSSSSLSPCDTKMPSCPLPVPLAKGGAVQKKKNKAGKVKDKELDIHQLLAAAEQGLHLLLSVSESCDVVVDVVNHEQLLLVLLYFLQPFLFFPPILTTAAMCLYTLTEDNLPSHNLLLTNSTTSQLAQLPTSTPSQLAQPPTSTPSQQAQPPTSTSSQQAQPPTSTPSQLAQPPTSTPSPLVQLEALLLPLSHGEVIAGQSHMLVVATAIAGVFQHMLTSLPTPLPASLISSVFTLLASVLDTDIRSLMTTLTTTPPHTPPQTNGPDASIEPPSDNLDSVLQDIENVLNAQLLALEIIANFCYTESDGMYIRDRHNRPLFSPGEGSEGEWEDVEEEVVIGGDVETPMEQDSHHQQVKLPEWLTAVIVEVRLVERVWRNCCLSSSLISLPHLISINKIQSDIKTRAMGALQNMLCGMDIELCGGSETVIDIWQDVMKLVVAGIVTLCDNVTGLLIVLVDMMKHTELEQCVSVEQLQVLSAACREHRGGTSSLTTDVLLIMARVGRLSLQLPLPIKNLLLQVVGETLHDCLLYEKSEWILARALDTLYDVFGADECPIQLFSAIQIMPTLKTMASQLSNTMVTSKRKDIGVYCGEVECARDNLQPFIDYMNTRTSMHGY